MDKVEINDAAGVLVAKVYFSPDGKKLRVVLPTLSNFAQVKIDIDNHLLDFTRDPQQAKRELKTW